MSGFKRQHFKHTTDTQATTTAQHTLQLDTFGGESYEGALLYVTLSVNNFAYQSIEEVDPVDWGTLLGSAGGMWGKMDCSRFSSCGCACCFARPKDAFTPTPQEKCFVVASLSV